MPDTVGTPRTVAMDGGGDNGKTQDNVNVSVVEANNYSPLQTPDNGTGLKKASPTSPQYRLLPNPNHGRFVVEAEYPETQDITVTVYDADGRLLLTMDGKGQRSYRFEGSAQTAGHYLINIISLSEHKTLKMVVN